MLLSRATKQDLKVAIIEAIRGKLPIEVGEIRLEATRNEATTDTFLNIKVFGPYHPGAEKSLLTYLTVQVKETL